MSLRRKQRSQKPVVVGIDLAGSPNRPTGYCTLHGLNIRKIVLFYTDEEILTSVERDHPDLVAIDAPLSIPKDRITVDDRRGSHYRQCDLMLRERRIRFFPITLGPMRKLTIRGMQLKKEIERMGIKVIEVFPGASYDVFGVPRKDTVAIIRFFKHVGLKPKSALTRDLSQDQLDAVMCAYTGYLYMTGNYEALAGNDGTIIVPRSSVHSSNSVPAQR